MVNSNVNATIPIFDVLALKEDYDEVIHTCNEFVKIDYYPMTNMTS